MPVRQKKTEPWTILFAGPGDSTEKNTSELLDEWLPKGDDDIEAVWLPDDVPAKSGLATVRSYLAKEFGKEGIDVSEDTLATLKEMEEVPNTYLVLLYGDESEVDETTRTLLAEAERLSIPVKDLTAGLDDISFTDDATDAVAAAEEKSPAQGRTARRSSRASRGSAKAEKDKVKPDTTSEDPPWKEEDETPPATPVNEATLALTSEELFGIIDARLSVHFYDLAVKLSGGKVIETTTVSREKPARGKARPADEPETFSFLVDDDDGTVVRKAGRGRPRSGQSVKTMTMAEAVAGGYEE